MRGTTTSVVFILSLVLAGVSGCQSAAAPTPVPTPVPPSPSLSPSPSPSATATPSPTPSPSPKSTPAAGAYQTVREYADALLAGRFSDAWILLGVGCQARWGSLKTFTTERTAFLKKAGTEYKLQISPTHTLSLSQWIIATSWASRIDQDNAFLFSLRWAGFGNDPHGTEIWIANPTVIGWELYLAN